MKRLIALIGAVATAFGLYAADSFSISFEGAESAKGVDASAMTFTPPSPDWKWDGDTLNIKAYGDGEMLPYGTGALARRDSSFVGEGDNDNYLTLETGTNALTRAVGGNVFLDQLVKFTGFEEYQTNVVAGTKIAVWMSGIEQEGTPAVPGNGEPEFIDDLDNQLEEGGYAQKPNPDYFAGTPASDDYIAGETNLYITVGKADIMGNAEPIALKIDGTFKLDTWYRLTIKSIGNVFGESQEVAPRAGFIVYINGVQAKSLDSEAKTLIATVNEMTSAAKGLMDDGALFPAIDTTAATFATVGYQGIGAIDDIILDDQGPGFDQATDVKIIFPLDAEDNPSVEVDYIDVGGVHMTYPCAVPAGTLITVYFKAVDGKKIMSNLQPQQLTVTASKFTIDISDVVVEDVVAKKNGTVDLAASEIADALAALNENDRIAFVKACEVWEEGAESCTYSFAPNTTITKTAAGWDVYVGNYDDGGECGGTFVCNADIANGFVLNVAIEDDTGDLGGTFAFAGNIAGTLKTAFGVNDSIEATLTGAGKVITMNGSLATILDGDGASVAAVEGPEEGWFTYALATEPTPAPITGFAIIIADAQAGTSTTNYYDTLDAAIDAAGTTVGDVTLPSVVTILENVTIENTVLISKQVTLDATGKTVTCAAKYPFFVKGGDLTITGGTFTQNVVDGIILWAKDGGKITVNGGDFSAIPDGEIAYVSTADALIEIYGGKFVMADKADGSKGDVLNVAQTLGLNKTDYIQVYGGSFSKDPAEGDDALGPTFVANGNASVKQDNGLWKVGAAIIATFKVDDAIVKAETNIVAFTPVAPTNPSKEGYTFTGWTPAIDEITESTVFVAQFEAEETKVDPEQPITPPQGKDASTLANEMNTKGIANYLNVPAGVTDAAAYTAMFAAKPDGKGAVIIALTSEAETAIKAELANTATSGSMLKPDATTSEVTITARPGLFYGIKAVGDVTTIGAAEGQNWVQASGTTVKVVRPTVSGNAAFFQAVCSPKAPPANN